MKKLVCAALALTAMVVSFKLLRPSSSLEGSGSFSSLNKNKYAPLKLPAFPKTGLNQFNSPAEVANFLESYHERKVFAWEPGYPIYIPAFDSFNRPYFRSHERSQTAPLASGFKKYQHGVWMDLPFDISAVKKHFPNSTVDEIASMNRQDLIWDPKMAVFDKDDILYSVVRIKTKDSANKHYVLMYSKDHGSTWKSQVLLSSSTLPEWYDLERPYTSKPLPGPPAFLYFQASGKVSGYESGFEYWQGTVGTLTLQTTSFDKNGELVADTPLTLSTTAQPIGYRSGSAVKLLRAGDKYFVVWLEATLDHKLEKNQRGRPTNTVPDKNGNPYSGIWVAEYDVKSGLIRKKEILKTWPLNDNHNQPGIVRSSQGILHVIGGSHGGHFTYTSSTKSDSIDTWSAPQFVNTTDSGYSANFNIPGVSGGSQTYVSFIIDSKDKLHVAYRLWAYDKSLFDFEYFGALAYQTAELTSESNLYKWSAPKILVYPNAQEYTHFYQVMTIDRRDHLYLEYSQMRPYAPYYFKTPSGEAINTSAMQNSALLKTSDGGHSWHLVEDEDFR
ncbi:hypothetical protein AZI87_00435 [Bdellovibrio bacteriovorus]|uniref:Uncharacterized protein n=1 Tax=Bdellovibrio bacteriovorus TaxID=959 RepID=A0A162GC59_BDEBC|nr:BNR-4 repeat-containing protein [Bdellovibrio bacteriovorus]KYG67785.1 hypothetical protein AZI87_00435 [Bdellovibrio bacteriovorus]